MPPAPFHPRENGENWVTAFLAGQPSWSQRRNFSSGPTPGGGDGFYAAVAPGPGLKLKALAQVVAVVAVGCPARRWCCWRLVLAAGGGRWWLGVRWWLVAGAGQQELAPEQERRLGGRLGGRGGLGAPLWGWPGTLGLGWRPSLAALPREGASASGEPSGAGIGSFGLEVTGLELDVVSGPILLPTAWGCSRAGGGLRLGRLGFPRRVLLALSCP